ncbi:NUDIX domain-containing protein [Candidatus Woesearchaeota archaeon]|jgi:ADP-ribose pyrophosphatase|nr:NUDIX domain-containing protein [Candidatus Woesearchaeota archaeon]
MNKWTQYSKDKIDYTGKIFQIVKRPMICGTKKTDFEIARRTPGVRVIIVNKNKMLINHEFRTEINGFDYRLPAGKVFDNLENYASAIKNNDVLVKHAKRAAIKECLEETGIKVQNIELLQKAHAGTTIEWDLYYFIVDEFEVSESGQQLEHGEVIKPVWKTFDEIKEMCLNGQIKEDRTVGVLLKFILNI